jgi:hypothetical protein
MALSAIDLSSKALLKIGANAISSFDEDSAEAEVADNLYATERDALLSAHPWTFATGQVNLQKLVSAPVADYDNAFQLPNDFLRALSAGTDERGRGVAFRLAERKLHTNANSVILTYIFRPDESAFPPFFDQAMIARLATAFCLPITENTSRTEAMLRISELEFTRGKLIDSQQSAAPSFEDFSLIEVRK